MPTLIEKENLLSVKFTIVRNQSLGLRMERLVIWHWCIPDVDTDF